MLHVFEDNTDKLVGSYFNEAADPHVIFDRNDVYGVIAVALPFGIDKTSVSCNPGTAVISYDETSGARLAALTQIAALSNPIVFLMLDSLMQIVIDRHGADQGMSTRIQGLVNGISTYLIPHVTTDENTAFDDMETQLVNVAAAYAALPAPSIQTIQGVLQ